MTKRQGSEPIMVCCPFHNKKRSFHNIPDRYCMNLSDIIAINICKQGSDNMQIAICDDEVSMVQILEEKIKKLLPDAVIEKYLSGDELIASGSKPDILFLDIQMPGMDGMESEIAIVAFKPGRAPIIIPPTTPSTRAIRLSMLIKFVNTCCHIRFPPVLR